MNRRIASTIGPRTYLRNFCRTLAYSFATVPMSFALAVWINAGAGPEVRIVEAAGAILLGCGLAGLLARFVAIKEKAAADGKACIPATAERLMLLILPYKDRTIIPGDLEEEFHRYSARHGHRYAYYWYWTQTFWIILVQILTVGERIASLVNKFWSRS